MARSSEGSPVLTIVFLTLFLLASFLSWAFFQDKTKLAQQLEGKEKQVTQKESAYRELFDENVTTAELLSGDERLDVDKLRSRLAEGNKDLGGTKTEDIFSLLDDYARALDLKNKDYQNALKNQKQAEQLLAKERKTLRESIENKVVLLKDKESEVKRLQEELGGVRAELKKQMDAVKAKTQAMITSLNEQISTLKGSTGAKDEEIEDLKNKIADLTRKPEVNLDEVMPKKPLDTEKEIPDGRVVSIDNDLRVAVIDIGRSQGVKRGMRFNIYRDSGISRRHLKGQIVIRKVHDLISEAFVTYERGFGQNFYLTGTFTDPTKTEIEQMLLDVGGKIAEEFNNSVDYLIIGKNPEKDTISRAQDFRIPVLREHLVSSFLTSADTIKPGDVVINPVFSVTHREKFMLVGEFNTPMAVLKEQIHSYGSKVVEKLDVQTDYVVIGSAAELENRKVILDANNIGVTIMKEEELLAFLAE